MTLATQQDEVTIILKVRQGACAHAEVDRLTPVFSFDLTATSERLAGLRQRSSSYATQLLLDLRTMTKQAELLKPRLEQRTLVRCPSSFV